MKTILALILAFAMLPFGIARAEAPAAAGVQLEAFRVVAPRAAGAAETLEPLKDVRPGDVVEYVATYANGTAQAQRQVSVVIPVPANGMTYIAAQKSAPANAASTDGKHYAALPLTRVEVQANGKSVTRDVPLAEYRALRFDLGDVPAGAKRSVRARLQVTAADAAAVANAR